LLTLAYVGKWPEPVGQKGARKLTFGAMVLLDKVSLRRPPWEPAPGHEPTASTSASDRTPTAFQRSNRATR